MKVIFTCGGTAGHVNPALALAGYMRQQDPKARFLFVGTPDGMERDLVEKAGYPFRGIPMGGYTQMVENMLDGIEVRLNVDYLADRENLNALAEKVVYTGPVDAYFGYKLGALQYRSVRFETEVLDTDNYQGNAVVNYTDAETPYTRIIEHKHFEFGTQPKTVISREYSAEWKKGDEPYYPVNDEKNGALYAEYKKLADAEPDVIFGGRLGEYKYYDMDQVIAAVLDRCESELH